MAWASPCNEMEKTNELFLWLVAGSQVFFSCSGDLTNNYAYEGHFTSEPTEKVTASLMFDEARQSFSFKPSGDTIGTGFTKNPDDVAHKLKCQQINERWDKLQASLQHLRTPLRGDVWSDDTSLYFNMEDSFWGDLGSREGRWNGTLDRVTGHLEVNLSTSTTKPSAWGKADWSLTCKKVDKLVGQ